MRQEISAVEYFSEESYMNTSDLSDGNCYCRPNKSNGDSDDQNHNLFIWTEILIADDVSI